jgi:hypothetical protein
MRIPDDGDQRAISSTEWAALDTKAGKLVLLFDLRERQRVNQEIIHAKDQRSPPPSVRPWAEGGTDRD